MLVMTEEQEARQSPCVLCGRTKWSFHHALRDDDARWVGLCAACGHIQITQLPTLDEDDAYYQTNTQIRTVVPESVLDDEQLMYKYKPFAAWQVKKAKAKIAPRSSVLEIGSGYGWFVELMRAEGYAVEGIEISRERRNLVRKRSGIVLHEINVLRDDLDDADLLGRFDAVWIYHVLEHIVNPQAFLKRVAKYLKKSGKIFVTVPNVRDFNKSIVKEYEDFCYLRAHVSYFSAETLTALFEQCGFSAITVSGDQPYSVENAFYWLREKKPFGEYYQLASPAGMEFLDDFYKQHLEQQLLSWSIAACGTRAG